MNRASKVLGFVFVALFGIYGCSKGPGSSSTPASESRSFYSSNSNQDARLIRLEEDFKAAAAARDTLRQKLAAAEDVQVKLQKQLEQTRFEGENLRAEIATRTGERDEAKAQFESFRRNIREALGQAETGGVAPAPIPPAAAINADISPNAPN